MRGRLLNGRYELRAPIGAGGMGQVWRAHDRSLDREVAVKLLVRETTAGEDEQRQLLARFRREARAAAALNSPYIVAVHDHGEDGGTPYLVMALVRGRSLDQVLREDGAVPVADALRWAADICRALDVAHAAGIVHRDVKPGNVMVTGDDGVAQVVDFGIATFVEGAAGAAGDARLTRTGQSAFGSVPYLAPERWRQEPGDGRTDLYALGCVLYELLVGQPPFTGSAVGVMYGHVHDAPPRPGAVRPGVPEPVERLVLDLLAKDPADRPRDAAATLARIGAAGPPPTEVTRPAPRPADPTTRQPAPVTKTTAPVSSSRSRFRGRRLVLTAAALLVVGVPAGFGVHALATDDDAVTGAPAGDVATVYEIGVAHSYRHVGADQNADAEEKAEYEQFTTQQRRTVESAFKEVLGTEGAQRFRVVPVAADGDTSARAMLAKHPRMLAVIGDTVDFSWVHDTDEAFLPEISTCTPYAHPGGAFAVPADDARQGEAMARYLRAETGARRVLVAEEKLWVDRADGIATGLRAGGASAEGLDVDPDEVTAARIPALVAAARADAVVVPTGTSVRLWSKALKADGFHGPVLTQGDEEGTCADSADLARAASRDKDVPDGVVRARNHAGEPDENLPARGNRELSDGASALATALQKLPTDASPSSLRHTLDREIQQVSVNGILHEVSFDKRRSTHTWPVWFDRRDGDRWTEIGTVETEFKSIRQ
ncbi:protein kinase [Streptomyces sp. NPDC087300]|uniref:protein kinase domain-containing protein n=1 Tax=Streptomyces sp. NPDC087300 TaxID=3365780 RepID=UPI00382B481B